MYLSDLASFFECLNKSIREKILKQLDMYDIAIDTNMTLLSSILYTLKALRNAVAHNAIVFDTRFKWVETETGIQNITLYSLRDYIIVVCCILKRIDFNGTRAIRLLEKFKKENMVLQNSVSSNIYSQIIQQNVTAKITALDTYLKA